MKDQLRLLRDCITNYIPAVVFQGDDSCAPENWRRLWTFTVSMAALKNSCTIGNSLLTRLRRIRLNVPTE